MKETVSAALHDNLRYILIIGFFAAIAGLLFGFDTGVIAGALQFIVKTFHISAQQTALKEFIVASVPVGALIGAVFSRRAARTIGRRRSVIVTAVLFTFGALLTAVAWHVDIVIIGRLIMGFGVGLSSMIVPMYLSEIAPPGIRGGIVFLFQIAIDLGLFFAAVINFIFAGMDGWRYMFAIGMIPGILLGIGMIFLPSSPRWLVLRGREDEALGVLRKLRHDPERIKVEFAEIKDAAHHMAGGIIKLLLNRRLLPLVIISFGLFVFQQLSGINTILYYAPTVFKNAGFSQNYGAILADMATTLTFTIATIIGAWVVDLMGRRKLFILGFIGLVVCLALMGLMYQGVFGKHIAGLSVAIVLVYITFFGLSLGPLCYLVMSELFPLKFKGPGMALASCANWGANIVVSASFLSLLRWLGISNTYYLYAALTFVGLCFVWFLLPETKGCPLEEIEQNLYAGKSLRQLGQPV